MTTLEKLLLLDRIHNLIRRKGTGNANELARKLNISRRMVYYYLEEIKNCGAEIGYCREKRSYFYENDVQLRFDPRGRLPSPDRSR